MLLRVGKAPKHRAIRIVVADAHAAARTGLRMALRGGEFDVVAEVADADAAIAATVREHPEICLLDADMPGDAIDATAQITAQAPQTAVVILATERGDEAMLEAIRAGAAGYLHKDMDPERLRYALRGVLDGEGALSRRLTARLMQEFRARERGRRLMAPSGGEVELSAREWGVLELLAGGASTREAATALGISEVTVRRHVSSVTAKLGVADRDAAVAALRAARTDR
jgi:DNA-binding NarL/FixJ family response regulator